MPLSGTYFAGKSGAATVDGVLLPGKSWDFEDEGGEIDVTNFLSVPVTGIARREYVGGFANGMFSVEGVYDPTKVLPNITETVPFIGKIGGVYTFTGEMVVRRVRVGTNIDNAATFRVEGRATGSVTLTIA